MPHYMNLYPVSIDGDTEIVLPGPRDVRIVSATNAPRIIGIAGGAEEVVIGIQNASGVPVTLVHDGAATTAERKLLMNGLGGNWTLPSGKIVRAIHINPSIPGFPDALRGWHVDNRGQEVLGRAKATISTSAPTNAGGLAVIPEMTFSVTTVGGLLAIDGWVALDLHDGDAGTIQLYVDGTPIDAPVPVAFAGGAGALDPAASIGGFPVHLSARVEGLSAAAHIIEAKWAASAGTLRAVTTRRGLRAEEIYP